MASIEQRGERSFRLKVELGYGADGKRIRRAKTVKIEDDSLLRKKKKLNDFLQAELYKFKAEVESGEYIAPEKTLFIDFAHEWEEKKGKKTLGIKTLEERLILLKNHINPYFKNQRIDHVNPMHIVTFYDFLSKDGARKDGKPGGLSPNTIYEIDKVLRSIFGTAKEWRVIKDNPMEGVKRPKLAKTEMAFLDQEQASQLIIWLNENLDPVWKMIFLTALIGGLRRGEVVPLELSDIVWERNALSINKSVVTIRGETLLKETKTGRTDELIMPTWYMNELKKYVHEWKKQKIMIGDKWEEKEKQYLFHSGTGKRYHPQTISQKWRKIRKQHGFNIRLHDLRHTMVTLLIEEGVNMRIIQERARHSSSRVTNDIYGHVSKRAAESAADKFDRFSPENLSKTSFGTQSGPN
ncbi:site-specific integrase [Bacillus sp. FJAT-52991]|uniref:Site-specific integrase n=1 Tax=Bacillus kandeliae TaxID=3129297 RepID=A0ABZ2N2I7_9BACI